MKERNKGVSAQLNSSSNSVITQPVAEAKKLNRNQKQIDALHMQFQDLKKKIKDVQSKNEKIIENIYKNQHNFKKKPHSTDHMIETTPIIHYENQLEKFNPDGDFRSQQSDPSQSQFKHGRPVIKKTSNIKKNGSFMNRQSQQYRRTQNDLQDKDRQKKESMKFQSSNVLYRPPLPNSNQFTYSANSQYNLQTMPQDNFQISQFNGMNPFHMSMQLPSYPVGNLAMSPVASYGPSNYQLDQSLKRQRQKINILQRQLQERQQVISSLRKFQKKYNNLKGNYCEVIQGCFEEFFDETLKKRMYEIQRYVKKNENKLKKLQIKIKDKEEDERSRRNIQQHRIKRSNSRSKKDFSPKISFNSANNAPKIPNKKSLIIQSDKSVSSPHIENSSKSKQSEQSKSGQQFEQIASQYQEIIKGKNKQIEGFQLRLRQKQKELVQMTTKCSKIQAKIADLLSQIPKIQKKRKNTDRQQNLLSNLSIDTESEIQITRLTKKLAQIQFQLLQKSKQSKEKEILLEKSNKKFNDVETKSKKIQLQMNKLKEDQKKLENTSKEHQLQHKIKKISEQLQLKQTQYNLLKENCEKLQSQKMQKDYQNFTMINRCKKMQTLLNIKEEKIGELQKIIQSSTGAQNIGDLLEKSVFLQKIDQNDLQELQQQKQKLEEQLINYRQEIFVMKKNQQKSQNHIKELSSLNEQLKSQNDNISLEIQSLRLNLKVQQFEKYKPIEIRSPLEKLLEEQNCLSEQEDNQRTQEQFQQLKKKYEQVQMTLKNQNHKTFQQNRKVIKLTSELAYVKEHLSQRQQKYQKLRKEHEQLKYLLNEHQQNLKQKDIQLQTQKKINGQRIKEIESQWLSYEQETRHNEDNINTSQDFNQLSKSKNFSEESFINYRNTYNNINAENQRLMEKIKQTEKIIQVQREMEEKIIVQYRLNIEKIKSQLREKIRQNQISNEENQNLKRKIRILEQSEFRLKQLAKNSEQQNLLGNSSQKIVELQMQLEQMRDINSKLTGFQQQLFKQIAQKQFQYENILKILNNKDRRIEQLQDIIQLKDINFGSNISQSNNKSKVRQSIQSQSSLKYSMLSNAQNNRTMELELSEAGESCFDQNQSMISNVSQVFGRDEFPYEKMQLKRVQQRRLFEKTAAYIKTLKKAIQQKNKKIKLLQKKIDSLRNSQLIRKDIYNVKENQVFESDDTEIFKDYYSVQLQTTHSQRYKLKQLQHETKLTIEQNNLLNNQIQNMQEELIKSEEQETSLMKLKDLYKEEIKSLIKKNQDQTRHFQEQMRKERTKVEQSQSVQKMQAIRQLFIKIITAFIALQIDGVKSKKRQERLKQLGDFLKVCTNLLNLQPTIQSKMLSDLKEIKR